MPLVVVPKTPGPDDGGAEPPDNGDMEARLTAVQQAIARIDAILPTLATKEELHKGFADQTKWIIGTAFAGMAVFITVMTFVLNNAVPKQIPAATQPMVIVVPTQAATAAPPAPASK